MKEEPINWASAIIFIFLFVIAIFFVYWTIDANLEGFKFPNEFTEEEIYKKLSGWYAEKRNINFKISVYEMELESKRKNMTVQYKKVPDTGLIMRVEYNGSAMDNVDFVNNFIITKDMGGVE